ncbi:MAG TPA: UDP-N-acetylmuramate--L-alanine ligase [Firmicutes bacterium]|jgi:UDP-N-acetylmuramate--alanine ligase|nr:UDP-N-acetylmuramate--L-alanine ligase [Bacillota bacterium]
MKHLHFVGIGGARLSGLAKLYFDRGCKITGSDSQESRVIRNMAQKGIQISYGHNASNINGADLVVYTNAVGPDNPEVLEAKRLGIPLIEGAELLGELMAEIGKGIAIAGTHGKTTTSAMTALILVEGGLDPTVLIGGELNQFQGNHRTGKTPYMVVEACEFKRSFLNLKPSVELITNIDWDHPDCFPTLDDVIKTFSDFVSLLPADGVLVTWGDDPNAFRLGKAYSGKYISFGCQEHFDWQIKNIRPVVPIGVTAELFYHGKSQGELTLKVPGRHNLLNATGAIALASELGIDVDCALKTLSSFTGVQRRFEMKGEYQGALIVDDYAHHPSAIRTTLAAARQVFKGRIWCVFQPHLFSRTKFLLQEFASSFGDADICVLADIYPAREIDPGDISSKDLAAVAKKHHQDVRYLGGFDKIYEHLCQNVQPGDLVITMGAGDVWKIGERLIKEGIKSSF